MSKRATNPSTTPRPMEPSQTTEKTTPSIFSIYSTEGTIPPPVEENIYPPVPEEVTDSPIIRKETTDFPVIPEEATNFPVVPEKTTESLVTPEKSTNTPIVPEDILEPLIISEFKHNLPSFTVEENPLESIANFEAWWSQTSPVLLKNLLESRFPIPKYNLEGNQLS